ncbi:hypothetical protein [Desulfosporosinus sp. BICA1-9]|uniref:hypothetical protein n=1 Tax=Desulfosporosinus sp. BICA1-9 TaxID=1531958 RepID=UPI00054C5589|nr:hypothetical protein [Desulfosporosinus sp. BICA1-9]KJS48693.1 MAG: hypothetical protein VR66_12725 [Peptococcaceae bacterium BRH_c23]KJS90487.1 MAG: hypothetical protein JL57_01500 [Desulfosporosinus sp. BICA1-9]HBW38429.1 hypothetical protein [Desulfosporosinus sp.]
MLKKLEGNNAALFKTWFHNNKDTIVDIEGKHFLIKPLENMVQEEIESDMELKTLIMQAKEDISNGVVYSTDDIIEAIEKGLL